MDKVWLLLGFNIILNLKPLQSNKLRGNVGINLKTSTEEQIRFLNKQKLENTEHYKNMYMWYRNEVQRHGILLDVPVSKQKTVRNTTKANIFGKKDSIEENVRYGKLNSNVLLKKLLTITNKWGNHLSDKRNVHNKRDAVGESTDVSLSFSDKERSDGFKISHAEDSPYAVMLVVQSSYDSESICSGSLLTRSWVLTAAHCLVGTGFTVRSVLVTAGWDIYQHSGSSGTQQREAKTFFTHPDYDRRHQVEYDVAVVEVSEEFKMTRYVRPVKLLNRKWDSEGYTTCVATGFGKVYLEKRDPEDNLRKTHYLEVKRGCPCLEADPLYSIIVCSKPREDYGLCKGDSGGGLVCEGRVVAVVSAMMTVEDIASCNLKKSKVQECGLKNTLTVFLDLSPYYDWISFTISGKVTGGTEIMNSGRSKSEPDQRVCFTVFILMRVVLMIF